MTRRWDFQHCWNCWLSVGLHVDHTDPSVTMHLPGIIVSVGRLKQPGFRRTAADADAREQVIMACEMSEVSL